MIMLEYDDTIYGGISHKKCSVNLLRINILNSLSFQKKSACGGQSKQFGDPHTSDTNIINPVKFGTDNAVRFTSIKYR